MLKAFFLGTLLFFSAFRSSSQKATVRLRLIDSATTDASAFLFQVRIANHSFSQFWIQDTSFLADHLAYPSDNLLHIFIDKKQHGRYHTYSSWKNPGIGPRDKCLDSCCNCILLRKGESLNAEFKILEGLHIENGRYRVQIGIIPPLFVCDNCEQLGEISSNYVYFEIKSQVRKLITASASTQNQDVPTRPEMRSLQQKQRTMLKNYALCKCLLQKYPTDSTLRNDGTLAGYIEMGSYQSEAYEQIDSFITSKASIKYLSKYKKNLYYIQCLDLYNSSDLESLIKALDTYLHVNK